MKRKRSHATITRTPTSLRRAQRTVRRLADAGIPADVTPAAPPPLTQLLYDDSWHVTVPGDRVDDALAIAHD